MSLSFFLSHVVYSSLPELEPGVRPLLQLALICGLVYRSGFLQCGEQLLGAIWRGDGVVEDDVLRAHFFAIDVFVGSIVWAERGTCERDPGEEPSSAGVGKYFSAQGDIGFSGGRPAHRASGGSGVATEFDLTAENTGSGTLAHEEKNKVCRIAPELQTCANALERHHGWGAPGAMK